MLEIDQFWRQLLPSLANYEFLYIYLDIATIISFIRIVLYLPARMLDRSSHLWKVYFI